MWLIGNLFRAETRLYPQATSPFDRSVARRRSFTARPRSLFSSRGMSSALSRFPLTANRCTNTLGLGHRLLRGARGARQACALGRRLVVASRLGLRVDRLGLRIADRLGQHPVQVGLGRSGGPCHLATIPFEFAASRAERSTFNRRQAIPEGHHAVSRNDDTAATTRRGENHRLSLPIRINCRRIRRGQAPCAVFTTTTLSSCR